MNQNNQLYRDLKTMQDAVISTQKDLLEKIKSIATPGPTSPAPSTQQSLLLPSEQQHDHPNIKYWTASQYRKAKKTRKMSTGFDDTDDSSKNVMTWYVETQDGEPVTNEVVEAIRTLARTIWQDLLRQKIAPPTWADIGLEARDYYEHHMCRRFPELSWGENNWKAHMIATDNYSSWYAKHVGRTVQVKAELMKQEQGIDRLTHHKSGKKRTGSSLESPMESDSKKFKGIGQEEQGSISEASIGSKVPQQPIILKNSLAQIFADPQEAAKLRVPSISSSLVPSSSTTNVTGPSPSADTTTASGPDVSTTKTAQPSLTASSTSTLLDPASGSIVSATSSSADNSDIISHDYNNTISTNTSPNESGPLHESTVKNNIPIPAPAFENSATSMSTTKDSTPSACSAPKASAGKGSKKASAGTAMNG
ncbi:hypothetical protein C0992_006607, partial [Termitomyces sp. T32_za158]